MTNIIIDSIRLRNFGAVKEATLRPLHDGLTGISGVSGAGKSTFLKGMRFALFNDLDKNVKISSLRRIGSDPKVDECSVSVVFMHDGQKIEVIRQLIGKNNTNVPTIYVDGVKEVKNASSTAEIFIKKRLGMDGKDFTTAMVIPQKQLDELVNDVASVRRSRIEKLAGIEGMSLAVKAAREEENLVKTQAKAMPGSEDVVLELEEEVSILAETLEQDNEANEKTSSYLSTLESDYNVSNADYDSKVQAYRKYKDADESHKAKQSLYSNLESTMDAVRLQLDSAMERFDVGTDSNVDELEERIHEYEVKQQELSNKAQSHRVAVETLESQARYNLNMIEAKEKQRTEAKGRLEVLIGKQSIAPTERYEQAKAYVVKTQNGISGLTAQKKQLTKEWKETDAGIKQINLLAASHKAECPTCHQHLDDISGLINSFNTTIKRIEDDGKVINEKITALEQELINANNFISEFDANAREQASIANSISLEEHTLADLEFQIRELKANLENNRKTKENNSSFDANGVAEELKAISEGKNEVLRLLEASKHTAQAQKEKNALEEQLATLQAKSLFAENEWNESRELLESLSPVQEEEISDLNDTLDTVKKMIEVNRQEKHRLAIEISNNEVRLSNAKKSLAKEKALVSTKSKLLSDLEHKSAVSDVLDEFRKSSIAKIAPELSDGATELISAMTNGKFIQIDLDSEFTPSILNSDGHTLTIHQLSGGELSVVALALRIAIGTLISGGTGGMLWLDEVLSAQDVGRRHAILAAVRALPVNQIVMINHTAEAEDIVDKVVHMVYSGVDGSYIDDAQSGDNMIPLVSNEDDEETDGLDEAEVVEVDDEDKTGDEAIPDNVPF